MHNVNHRAAQVTVGGGIAPPAAAPEPCLRLSPHTAPQHLGCCHQHRFEKHFSHSDLVNVPVEVERFAPGLPYVRRRLP